MNEVVEEYTQRENQFKSKTEEIVKKLKDKIKKEKKASEKALAEVQEERKVLQQQIMELKQQHRALTDSREQEERVQIERLLNKIAAYDNQFTTLEGQCQEKVDLTEGLEEEMKLVKAQNDQITDTLIQMLTHTGIEIDEESTIRSLLEKLQEHLQNYEEDKRSLMTLIEEKEKLSALSDQYYHEKETIIIERNQIQEKLEKSGQAKVERKLKVLEEERSLMRSDFNIQINSLIEEND